MRAADDVDVVADREAAHQLLEALGVIGQRPDRFGGGHALVFNRQQLQREQLRKHREVRLVVGDHIDEILDLLLANLERGERALLILNGCHAHGLQAARRGAGDYHRVLRHLRVAPDHMRRKAARFMIERQIIGQDADRLEAVANLKADHRIAQFPRLHQFEIFLRRADRVPAPRQFRHAPGKHDALQPQVLAQLLSLVVEALTDAQAAKFGIDADVHAVEPVALGIVARGEAAAGDRRPVMRFERHHARNPERDAIADDIVFIDRDELASKLGCWWPSSCASE